MKNIIKVVAVAVAALMLCLSLVSCGTKLNGEYECDMGVLGEYTLEFKGSDVTLSVKNILGKITDYEGTYEINDDKITFTFEDDEAPLEGSFEFDEDEDSGDIEIGELNFKKVEKK